MTQWRYCKQSEDWRGQTYFEPFILCSEISMFRNFTFLTYFLCQRFFIFFPWLDPRWNLRKCPRNAKWRMWGLTSLVACDKVAEPEVVHQEGKPLGYLVYNNPCCIQRAWSIIYMGNNTNIGISKSMKKNVVFCAW